MSLMGSLSITLLIGFSQVDNRKAKRQKAVIIMSIGKLQKFHVYFSVIGKVFCTIRECGHSLLLSWFMRIQ